LSFWETILFAAEIRRAIILDPVMVLPHPIWYGYRTYIDEQFKFQG
jgi:hypothetical protein